MPPGVWLEGKDFRGAILGCSQKSPHLLLACVGLKPWFLGNKELPHPLEISPSSGQLCR